MKKSVLTHLLLPFLFLLTFSSSSYSQWMMDLREQMDIPQVINISSSDTHFYVLSEREGLVVFRANNESMQWLYSSTGMQQRGNILESDIRFSYLYGNNRRLTVIEPTSVLGVYSSTVLPHSPRAVNRVGNNLYIALGDGGLGMLSLETPESVDSDVTFLLTDLFSDKSVIDLATDEQGTLYALTGDSQIHILTAAGSDSEPELEESVSVNRDIHRLFLANRELIGSDQSGNIYLISSNGQTRSIASVGERVRKLRLWNGNLVVHTEGKKLWLGPFEGELQEWKANERGGNYFTITEDKLWVSEFDKIAPVTRSEPAASGEQTTRTGSGQPIKLEAIMDVNLPFPRPLILPINLESGSAADVTFSYQASFDNARIRGNTFYWQPLANQTGQHTVEIIATTAGGQSASTEFTINLRPFNSPPRFTPSRPISIPVGEAFQLDIKAVDPDGRNPNLIRYLGVDMPDGARINEKTGLFTWLPNIRQVGSHTFQVIATDQYGAAASQDFEIRVVEIEEESTEEDQR